MQIICIIKLEFFVTVQPLRHKDTKKNYQLNLYKKENNPLLKKLWMRLNHFTLNYLTISVFKAFVIIEGYI